MTYYYKIFRGESRNYRDTKVCFGKRGRLIRRRLLKKDRADRQRTANKSLLRSLEY